jgi:hypothetical protein
MAARQGVAATPAFVPRSSGMDQKEWEERLDRYADRTAHAVRQGVNILEDAFEKGKETLKEESAPGAGTDDLADATGETPPRKGSARLGVVLVFLGIAWLLHSLGIFDQPVFPILLIVAGIYFIVRTK